MTVDLDTHIEMYLKPVATGVYDWIPINRDNGMVVRREQDVVITDGNQNLNSDAGVPNRARFAVNDPDGNLNRKNPMGAYWGSIGLGVQTRIGVLRVDDQLGRAVTDTNWGSVGNTTALPPNGDTWTAGASSGGTVAPANWSVSGGTARHSLPVAGSYRLSELSKTTRLFTNVEVLTQISVPTNNVTGTGALATEVWLRTIDVSNFLAVSLAFQINETLQIAIYDRTAGVNRYLLNYTTIPGFSLSSTTDYTLRCHVEGGTVRAKVWATSGAEPLDWQAAGSDAVIREGYVSIADYAFSGNTNTYPLVFQHEFFQVGIPVFTGEITDLVPSGDDKTEPKVVEVSAAGLLDRYLTTKAPAVSAMRRGRASIRRWLWQRFRVAVGGSTSVISVPTSLINGLLVDDFFFLFNVLGAKKEDTKFTITSTAVVGANTELTFTPDARDAVIAGDFGQFYRSGSPSVMPIAYWPMEDGSSATQVSSGLVGGIPMTVSGPTPEFAAESGFPCSAPILRLNQADLFGLVPDYTDVNIAFTIGFVLFMPASDEAGTGSDLIQFLTTGTGYSCDLRYTAAGNGSLRFRVHNSALTLLYDSGDLDLQLRGTKCHITLTLEQVGGTVIYTLVKTLLDGTSGGYFDVTITGGVTVLGKITQIRANSLTGYDNVAMGHLTVVPGVWEWFVSFLDFSGWTTQPALHRYYRLCYENSIPFTHRTDWDVLSSIVGFQKTERLGELLKDPAESDGGFLIGARGALALEYITRGALTNQDAIATFNASAGHVKPPFDPTIDYSAAENLVTVTRVDGTTAVSELTSGPMSTEEAPIGIGTRDGGYTLSLGADSQVQNHADWRRAIGTLDQYRVPRFEITAAGTSAVSVERMLSIGVGMRIDITNLDSKNIYDDLQQLVRGCVLRLGQREYPRMTLVCSPYEVYRAFALTGDDLARPDMTDTKLGATLTTTQTGSVTLTSDAGYYLVTTLASDFPLSIMIEGEEITFSAVTGDTSPQTATISARSVNGVVKSHIVGETVKLARPNRYQFR